MIYFILPLLIKEYEKIITIFNRLTKNVKTKA